MEGKGKRKKEKERPESINAVSQVQVYCIYTIAPSQLYNMLHFSETRASYIYICMCRCAGVLSVREEADADVSIFSFFPFRLLHRRACIASYTPAHRGPRLRVEVGSMYTLPLYSLFFF